MQHLSVRVSLLFGPRAIYWEVNNILTHHKFEEEEVHIEAES